MPNILVVDDEPDIRQVIKRLLRKEGHEVIEASNGREALEIVSYNSPDIILLDVVMPVMDGFKVLRTLRGNPSTEGMPVILLTTLDAAQGAKAARELGVEHYISKPLEPGVVELSIRVALRDAQAVNTPVRTGELLQENVNFLDFPLS